MWGGVGAESAKMNLACISTRPTLQHRILPKVQTDLIVVSSNLRDCFYEIIECFEDKTLDIYDGQVIQDDDLIQNKEDVYDYEPPETESDKLWKSIHKKHNNIELYRQSKEKQKMLQMEPVTPTEEAKSYNPFNV